MLLSPEMENILALDIGGTNFSVAIIRGSQLRGKLTRPTNRTAGPRWMLDQMEEMVAGLSVGVDLDACGVGFGGPVDFNAQKVITSTHVGGWEGFDLVHEVVSRFRVPTIMDRDSMAGALGEGRYGAGVKHATSRQGVCEQCARSLSFALRILTQEAALLGSAAV